MTRSDVLALRASVLLAVAVIAAGCSPSTEQPASDPKPSANSVMPSEKSMAPAPDRRSKCTSGKDCNMLPDSVMPQKPPPLPPPQSGGGDSCGIGGYSGSGCLAGMPD